jgi:hypothetical protein
MRPTWAAGGDAVGKSSLRVETNSLNPQPWQNKYNAGEPKSPNPAHRLVEMPRHGAGRGDPHTPRWLCALRSTAICILAQRDVYAETKNKNRRKPREQSIQFEKEH